MMGKKKLSEIKAELGLSPLSKNGKPARRKPMEGAELERHLSKQLAELERELSKRPKRKKQRRAKQKTAAG